MKTVMMAVALDRVVVASDMSADECDKTPTKATNKQRSSIVHGFAIKKSPNEYVCNLCSKVR